MKTKILRPCWETLKGILSLTTTREPKSPGQSTFCLRLLGQAKRDSYLTYFADTRVSIFWPPTCRRPRKERTLRSSTTTKLRCLSPHRIFGSRDTFTLFEDTAGIDKLRPRDPANIGYPLLTSRCALLHQFLLARPDATPTEWLWVQISCIDHDAFDALYRLFRLVQVPGLGFGSDPSYEEYTFSACAAMQCFLG